MIFSNSALPDLSKEPRGFRRNLAFAGIILTVFRALTFIVALSMLPACGSSTTTTPAVDTASTEYLQLLAKFPEDGQGEGREPYYTSLVTQEPMTYALVLSSESLHYRSFPSFEGVRRIKNAANWLIANSDTDADGKLGWGLKDAWDAFSDGSTNPSNHPYTITTAIVLNGLLDASEVAGIWTEAELSSLHNLVIAVSKRWCDEVWSGSSDGGFFWYSPSAFDAHFVINASSMMMGMVARTERELSPYLLDGDRTLFRDRIGKAFSSIVAQARFRNGAPFWSYIALPNDFNQDKPNDLVHHVYILWGLRAAQPTGGTASLTWNDGLSSFSLTAFWKNGDLYDYPQDVSYADPVYTRPAILWGVGALLAYYSVSNETEGAANTQRIINTSYGYPYPDLRLFPASYSADPVFYARYAAHVLWGLAYKDFHN